MSSLSHPVGMAELFSHKELLITSWPFNQIHTKLNMRIFFHMLFISTKFQGNQVRISCFMLTKIVFKFQMWPSLSGGYLCCKLGATHRRYTYGWKKMSVEQTNVCLDCSFLLCLAHIFWGRKTEYTIRPIEFIFTTKITYFILMPAQGKGKLKYILHQLM